MINDKKSLEFYFDSNTFTKEQLMQSIEEAKKDFPKKIIEPKLFLNKFGTYILQIDFKDKNNYLNRLKQKRKILNGEQKNKKNSQKSKAKKHHRVKNVQEIYGTRTYGQYKQTGTYRPI